MTITKVLWLLSVISLSLGLLLLLFDHFWTLSCSVLSILLFHLLSLLNVLTLPALLCLEQECTLLFLMLLVKAAGTGNLQLLLHLWFQFDTFLSD